MTRFQNEWSMQKCIRSIKGALKEKNSPISEKVHDLILKYSKIRKKNKKKRLFEKNGQDTFLKWRFKSNGKGSMLQLKCSNLVPKSVK